MYKQEELKASKMCYNLHKLLSWFEDKRKWVYIFERLVNLHSNSDILIQAMVV